MMKWAKYSLLVLLLLAAFGGQGAATAELKAPPQTEPTVTLRPDGLRLTWQAAEVALTPGDDGSTAVAMPGFNQTSEAGSPILPRQSVLVALPPGADPTLTILSSSETNMPLLNTLAIAPRPAGVMRNDAGDVVGGGYQDAVAEAPFDKPTLTIEEIGVMRGVRLARVTFYPVRPWGNQLRLTTSVEAEIQFNAAGLTGASASQRGLLPKDPFHQAISDLVVNSEQVQVRQSPKTLATAAGAGSASVTAVIEVDRAGITAVTYHDLAAIGFPIDDVNPHQLQLTHNGIEVALEWDGNDDERFAPGEALRFYAAPWFSRWQNPDVYVLSAGTTGGLRMSQQPAAPEGLDAGSGHVKAVIEENNIYTPDCICGHLPAGRDGERWTWADLRWPGQSSGDYALDLANVDAGQAAELKLWLIGFTAVEANPDHLVDVTLNGQNLGSLTWDGKTAVTGTMTIPAGLLQASNTLSLNLPGAPGAAIDGIWLDAVQVSYRRNNAPLANNAQLRFQGESNRHAYHLELATATGIGVYDVSVPGQPVRLTDLTVAGDTLSFADAGSGQREYVVATESSLYSPSHLRLKASLQPISGADYVIVSPAAFIPALEPLVALRQSQGMTVVVEPVQAIYDGFGHGRSTPAAIRAYLDHAYHTWNPAPTTVLLVGDGTSDPKQYKADSKASWIPPFLADVDPWMGEVAADNRYVTVDGDDVLPDMMIGRLPVNSLAETQVVVNKLVQYETDPLFGDWNGTMTLVADDADGAGDFADHSDKLIDNFIAEPWMAETIYHMPPTTTESDIQTAVRQSWNAGRGIVTFTGHSSIHQWGAERYFHLDDVATLANGARLPVVLEMTCFTGSFQQPYWDTLDEALVRHQGGGAVAVWGSTGLGVATGHQYLAHSFLDSMIVQNQPSLGRAVLAGKLNLFTKAPAHRDLVDTFTLLGDPATQYNYDFWPGYSTYLPAVQR